MVRINIFNVDNLFENLIIFLNRKRSFAPISIFSYHACISAISIIYCFIKRFSLFAALHVAGSRGAASNKNRKAFPIYFQVSSG